MKESSKKTSQSRKPVQYRARHKKLRDLREEDTKHGFQERIKVERSQNNLSEPVFCGVWRGGETESIELTTSNYRIAPTKLEDNVRATRTSTSGESGGRPSISPTSSTYAADLELLDDLMDSPYGQSFLPLTPIEETLPLLSGPHPGYYPTVMGSAVTGGHPLPTASMQGIPLHIEQNLNIVLSGYTGYGDPAFANSARAAGNSQGLLIQPNLRQALCNFVHAIPVSSTLPSSYDYYPTENQLYLTQGSDLPINQAISSGWEPDPNYMWNSSMLDHGLFDQVATASNTTQPYSEFEFPQLADDNHYMPDIYQSNTFTQRGYYSGL